MQSLLVVAHGSHLNDSSSTPTYEHGNRIRETGVFDEVREAFWKEEPGFREALRTLEAEEVYVVPLFISEGYFTEQVIPRELRLEGWAVTDWESPDGTSASHATYEASDVDKTVTYCGPVGTHDSMADVIVERSRSVTDGVDFSESGLAVVGHGTERNENSAKAVYEQVRQVRDRGLFAEVDALFMDESPEVDDVTEHFESDDIVVVPMFIADGFHTQEDIPKDMGLTEDFRDGYPVPATVDGHRIWYSGAVGTEPRLANVILERSIDGGATVPAESASMND